MPTYAYRCTACEHAFEIQQSFTDDALTVCPECEGRLRKVFSSVGVVFKGSGFYRTDARSSGGSSSGGSSSVPAQASGSSDASSGSSGSGSSGSSGGSGSAPAASSGSSSTSAASA